MYFRSRYWASVEVFIFAGAFSLGMFGAKHLDKNALLMAAASSGLCFLSFLGIAW